MVELHKQRYPYGHDSWRILANLTELIKLDFADYFKNEDRES